MSAPDHWPPRILYACRACILEEEKRIYELLLEIKKYVTGENLSWRRADNLIWWIGPI